MPLAAYSQLTIFDLDHTLLKASSSFRFGMYLYHHKAFSMVQMIRMTSIYFLHKTHFLSLFALHQAIFKILFHNREAAFFLKHVDQFLDDHLDTLIDQQLLGEFKRAQEAKHYIIILSSSPHFLVQAIAKRLGASSSQGSTYAVDIQGLFCHIPMVIDGHEKAKIAQTLATQMQIPMKDTYAYSDSILDLKLLQTVGVPIAVNPDKKTSKI